MQTPTARLILPPLIAAIVAFVLLVLASSGDRASGIGNAPPECFSGEDHAEDGTSAPTNLTLSWSPYWQNGQLISAITYLAWEDNSNDELCFIVEFSSIGGGYQSTHVADANELTISMSSFGCETYRVYALTATGRSAYSNEVSINQNCNPGPPTHARPRGDLNCDGAVNAIDSLFVLRRDAGLDVSLPDGCLPLNVRVVFWAGGDSRERSDLNCDETTSPVDALVALRFDAGLDTGLPLGCYPLDTLVVPALA
ncbi:MAG TPA: hypothetical protein VMR52_07840 [Dehalococcoidia bacterium]|nr:hypothetical protein [Dehalococcoidia bacterium]